MSVRVYNVERAALVFGPCASGAGDVWRSGTRESPIAERLTPYVKPLYRGRVRETVLVIHVVECKPEVLTRAEGPFEALLRARARGASISLGWSRTGLAMTVASVTSHHSRGATCAIA